MSDFLSPPPPPPPSLAGAEASRPRPVGWVAVVAGVLGLLGLVLPWYSPRLSKPVNGVTDLRAGYHAWSGSFFLVAAPILLIVFAVLWWQALRGRPNGRFAGSANPTRSLSVQSVVAGVIALGLGLLSFPLMSHFYQGWNQTAADVKKLGSTLQKNPQTGLYALLLGAVLLIAAGIAGLALGAPAAPATPAGFGPAPDGYGPAPDGYGPAPDGYGPAPDGYGPAPDGYGPAPDGYGPDPDGHSPAPGGYQPPAGPPQS